MKRPPPTIVLEQARKHYNTGARRFDALHPVSLEVDVGEYVGVIGPSGSGKSTLLNLIAGIVRPTSGQVRIAGEDLSRFNESQLATFRGLHIGIVFQFFQLIPTLTAIENVVLAMDLVGAVPRTKRRPKAQDQLDRVGLSEHHNKVPSQMSGGEQQRVAVARALANDPDLLVADEPTGNLDSVNSAVIWDLFDGCVADGRTVVVATHETGRLDRYHRLIRLADGRIRRDPATA